MHRARRHGVLLAADRPSAQRTALQVNLDLQTAPTTASTPALMAYRAKPSSHVAAANRAQHTGPGDLRHTQRGWCIGYSPDFAPVDAANPSICAASPKGQASTFWACPGCIPGVQGASSGMARAPPRRTDHRAPGARAGRGRNHPIGTAGVLSSPSPEVVRYTSGMSHGASAAYRELATQGMRPPAYAAIARSLGLARPQFHDAQVRAAFTRMPIQQLKLEF